MTTDTNISSAATAATSSPPLLNVDRLNVEFQTGDGVVKAVNGLSYSVDAGETVAILGESGSGKSVNAQAVMGIIDTPPGRITGGSIEYRGDDILKMSKEEQRKIRADHIAMVFQDALTALNPVFTVGWQLSELFRQHRGLSKKEAKAKSLELLDRVRIPGARERIDSYPHEFSGGMRQRVMIAMGIALDPSVLIADEPTTALDVTVQAQIMDLLKDLQDETGMGLLLITHDLGVVAEVADRVVVMYAGRELEKAPIEPLYASPSHPYTAGLMKSIPRHDVQLDRLEPITGSPPDLRHIPQGCPFHPRCPHAQDRCRSEVPELIPVRGSSEHSSACHFVEEIFS